MPEPLNIALIGGGTVGGGVAKILLEHPERIASRAGRPVHLKRVVVRDAAKPRPSIPILADRNAAALPAPLLNAR